MRRSFCRQTLDTFMSAIRESIQEITHLKMRFVAWFDRCPDLAVPGARECIVGYLDSLLDLQNEALVEIPKLFERIIGVDVGHQRVMDHNNLRAEKFLLRLHTTASCFMTFKQDTPYYSPEQLMTNLSNLDEKLSMVEPTVLYMHYKDKTESILGKPARHITEDEWKALGIIAETLETEAARAAFTQRITDKYAELLPPPPEGWAAVGQKWSGFFSSPSLFGFVDASGETLKQCCRSLFKDTFLTHLYEGFIDGAVALWGFVINYRQYGLGALITGLDNIPLVKEIVPDFMADWGKEKFHGGNAAIASFIDTTVKFFDDPIGNAIALGEAIGDLWDELAEERGIDGALAYIAGRIIPEVLAGKGAGVALEGLKGTALVKYLGTSMEKLADIPGIKKYVDGAKHAGRLTKEALDDLWEASGLAYVRMGIDLGVDALMDSKAMQALFIMIENAKLGSVEAMRYLERLFVDYWRYSKIVGITPGGLDFDLYRAMLVADKAAMQGVGLRVRGRTNMTRTERLATFTDPKDRAIAEVLENNGRKTIKNELEGVPGAGRQGDSLVDGVKTEFKSLTPKQDGSPHTSKSVQKLISQSRSKGGQAEHIVIDARNVNISKETLHEGISRYFGNSEGGLVSVEFIVKENGADVIYKRISPHHKQ